MQEGGKKYRIHRGICTMQTGVMKDRRQGRICRQEERDRRQERICSRRKEGPETGQLKKRDLRNRQAGICRKEESRTAYREEYARRRKEGQETGRQLKKTRSEPEFVNI
jgi:hypothetical protein